MILRSPTENENEPSPWPSPVGRGNFARTFKNPLPLGEGAGGGDHEEHAILRYLGVFGGVKGVCLLILFLLQAYPLWAQVPRVDRSPDLPVDVTADKLTVLDEGTRIEASGNVEIRRELTTVTADEVRVNRITRDVEARGNVTIDDPEWKVRSADSIQLNLEKETGELRNADVFIERGHVSIMGRRLQKFAGQTYRIDEGFFTTCVCESDLQPWRMSADSVDLTVEGMAVVRNGYFYIFDVPVFYVPYAFFPLRTERQTGFLFPSFGTSRREGFLFQQPFFWAIDRSTDVTATFHVQTESRIGFLGEFRRIFDRVSDLRLNGSYFNESLRHDPQRDVVDPTIADPRIPLQRWNIITTHRYTAGTDWITFSDIAWYSDNLFTRELTDRFPPVTGPTGDIRRSRYAAARFGAFNSWDDLFVRGEWNFFQDFIQPRETTLHRTPQAVFWGRRFSAEFPLEFRWHADAVNYIRREGGEGFRLDLRPELIFPLRLIPYGFGQFSVAPRETFYHLHTPVRSSQRTVSRELVEVRGNLGTTVSRIFPFAGTQLRAIKHVIEPELEYLFVPGRNQTRIPIMDNVDRVNRRNVVTMVLRNRIWGRFVSPLVEAPESDVELIAPVIGADVREVASLRAALSYDIDRERRGGRTLSDLDLNLGVIPTALPIRLGFDTGLTPRRWNITQAQARFSLVDPRPITRLRLDPDFNRPNSLSLSYSFLSRRLPNALLAENPNIDLDVPPNCPADALDPRCRRFDRDIVGQLSGNVFVRLTDHIVFFGTASYDVRDTRFPGYRTAVKFLSRCECWSFTISMLRTINPARSSFNFDFNLLGLGGGHRTTLQ